MRISVGGAVRRLLDALYLGAGWLAGLFLIAIFLLMMGMSLGREVGINIPAGDDIVSWCMAACAFLGLAHTFKKGEMIRVGLVIDKLRGGVRRAVEILALLFALGFSSFFAWYAVRMTYDSWRFNDMAQGVLAVPLWIPQIGYSAGLTILAIAVADELVRVIGGNTPSYEKPPPQTAEEVIERAIQSSV